jgi:hypothetical protein
MQMASERQRNANRRKAAPERLEGRAAVRASASTAGLARATAVLPGEDRESFDKLRQGLLHDYLPATHTERMLVEDFVVCSWRLLRVRRVETELWRVYIGALRAHGGAGEATTAHDSDRSLAGVLVEVPQQALASYFRHERAVTRDFYRALHELQATQRERRRRETIPAAAIPAEMIDSGPQEIAAAAGAASAPAAQADDATGALSENGIVTISQAHAPDARRPHARAAEPEHVGDPQSQHPAGDDRPVTGPPNGLPLSAA